MSKVNIDEVRQTLAQNLGVSADRFKNHYLNPNNNDLFESVEHNDLWGVESKVFALCFQSVRDRAGPYKIFGSQ